jgi:hypothetical protein
MKDVKFEQVVLSDINLLCAKCLNDISSEIRLTETQRKYISTIIQVHATEFAGKQISNFSRFIEEFKR